jgi:hypothetical protein
MRHSKLILIACGLFAISLIGGCTMDPTTTVTVEVSGLHNSAESEQVLSLLTTMYDGDTPFTGVQSQFNGEQLTVRLSPVADVDRFASRINFGTVTRHAGRTIQVRYQRYWTSYEI